jgi:hypothetical protein
MVPVESQLKKTKTKKVFFNTTYQTGSCVSTQSGSIPDLIILPPLFRGGIRGGS